MGLRGVFQNAQMATRGNFADGIYVRGSAVEMHGKNGASARRDGAFDEAWIQIRGGGININKYGPRAAIGDGFRRRQKRIRRGDYVIAGLNAERQQAQM